MDNDFGFSAVSEIPQTSVPIEPNKLEIIINKLDELLERKELDDEDRVVRTQQEVTDRLQKLYDVVMPLYKSLLSSSDKDYIYWPGRKEKIQIEMNKIESIMNG
jgi:transcriptional regulator of heat shock response